ncbi:Mg chelatase-like protein [Tessaracoccus aquimaris]|uniref:Mg chelatase-like protein n=1 Tax=Tessaracoccus aquimaris TaxID=1332264 RepID=A0A1Q2CKF2_9ACTN|nr:YifB family Mg chelatase-like AAA ATPase [Tessaracoccus aquimaris]AQP46608.1 Mg chelatase-like protein [Tessaracoccus aquimaris]
MRASTWSVALTGIEGVVIEVEAAKGGGLPRTQLVGLPDKALSEAKDRVKAAVAACGLPWPPQLITVNLSPANLPKTGSHYDVAIAIAAIAAEGGIKPGLIGSTVLFGELSLDGRIRNVRGVLPAMLAAARAGFERAIVPSAQCDEAALVPGLTVWGAGRIDEVVDILMGRLVANPTPSAPSSSLPPVEAEAIVPDLADVMGHLDGKFALEVAAAGRHHLFLHGAPGVGKTMLAARLPSLLPDLSQEESLEVSAIHSLAGHQLSGLIQRPPYADPHHSVTPVALLGGGSGELKPGAISLAHRGVLFLDECPDFGPKLDALRTPLENGTITISRARATALFPARFQLVLAANPCPCGMWGVAGAECRCDSVKVRRYQERISGPIMDRIDIRHQMLGTNRILLDVGTSPPEPSAVVAARVAEARDRQRRRLADTPWSTNGEVAGPHLRKQLPLPDDLSLLNAALERGALSLRGVDKVLRVAWTLADLAGRDAITARELRAALRLRQGDQLQAA